MKTFDYIFSKWLMITLILILAASFKILGIDGNKWYNMILEIPLYLSLVWVVCKLEDKLTE